MTDQSSSSLIPTKDEIKQIIVQVMATNPMQVPVVVMQIQFARFMAKCLEKLSSNLDDAIDDLENSLDK